MRSAGGIFAAVVGLLALPGAGGSAPATAPAVALDLSTLDAALFRQLDGPELERRAVLRLVQDGFAVVAKAARPEVLLQLKKSGGDLVLVATVVAQVITRVVPLADEPLAELHLELAQKLAELAREAARLIPPPTALDSGWPQPPDAGATVAPSLPPLDAGGEVTLEPSARTEVVLGASALWREGPVDPLIRLAVRLPLAEGLRLHLQAGLVPSSGVTIQVYEPELSIGVARSLFESPQLQLEEGVMVGAVLHIYSLADSTAADAAGVRLDALLSVPLTLTWHPLDSLTFSAVAAPGVSTRRRDHRRGTGSAEVILWSRGAFRVELGLAAAWRF